MRLLVINLHRAQARRDAMQNSLAACNLAFSFLQATDGASLAPADRALHDPRRRRHVSARPLTDGEIACAVSHLRALRMLVASEEAMLAVLEDDVTISPDLPRALAALERATAPFDLVALHRRGGRRESFCPCGLLLPDLAIGRIRYGHMNLQGYVVSRAGAEKILHRCVPLVHAIDKQIHRWWANGLDLYALERGLVREPAGQESFLAAGRDSGPRDGSLRGRLARLVNGHADSWAKRRRFAAYLQQGRAAWAA